MSTDTSAVRNNAAVPDSPRAVRIADDVWFALTEAVMQRREGESFADYKARVDRGNSAPLKLAARAYIADPEAFEEACRRIIGDES